MSINATVTKRQSHPFTFKSLPDVTETIEAEDKDKLFALFFREYDNCYKYCNHVSYFFTDPELKAGYRVWFSDVNNYANNGGDMH